MANQASPSLSAILRMKKAAAYIGIGRSTLYEKLREGGKHYDPTLPKPVTISTRVRGIYVSELDQWLAERAAKREGGNP